MLKLDDIVALAKQGYKPADVKELIELSKSTDAQPDSSEDVADTGTTSTPAEEKNEEKNEKASKDTIADVSEDDKVIDYKKKVEELEKKIQDLQKANTHRNIADTDDTKSDSEVFADVMKSFM